VLLTGDAHLSNFGLFASPERQMLFDINDFDETLPGPREWDLKRLAASFEVAARDLGRRQGQSRVHARSLTRPPGVRTVSASPATEATGGRCSRPQVEG
jgi:hypothetical protein